MTMTDTEAKALALVNADNDCNYIDYYTVPSLYLRVTLKRALEREARHAAELREQAERFSEAVDAYSKLWSKRTPSRDEYNTHFAPFILPAPDPLVEAIKACEYATLDAIEPEFAESLRAAIEARGGRIVWGDDR